MKRIVQLILTTLGLYSGCSQSGVLTPNEFTKEFVRSLRKAYPEIHVQIVNDLELKLTSADGRDSSAFLNNAYDTYKQDPKAKQDVLHKFVSAFAETVADSGKAVDRTRVVPVIKDRPWLEEVRQTLAKDGAKKLPEPVFEDYNSDLVIVYAEDSQKNMRYVPAADFEAAKIKKSDLRGLACENLKRLLPKIERVGANGLYMINAGGDYEASLLLLDSLWTDGQMQVQGDFVVAIPTRDLLLVTGSRDSQGIEKLKQVVEQAAKDGSYRLTSKLFVYRNGKFVEFTN